MWLVRAPADERFAPREGSALRSRIQGGVGSGAAFLERRAITPGGAALSAAVCAWPSISKAFRIPLLRGRGFAASDDGPAPRVAIVNAAMAKRSFPDGDALGRRIEIGRYTGQWVSKEFEGAAEVTANLSIAAAEVGRKLVVFDSFDGIPEDEEPYGRMWKEIGGPRPVIDGLGTEKLIAIMKPPH